MRGATDKQRAFLHRLASERVVNGRTWADHCTDALGTDRAVDQWIDALRDAKEASKCIDALRDLPRAGETHDDDTPAAEPVEGVHYVGPDDGSGTVYKVQRSQTSGSLYAKRLVLPPALVAWREAGREMADYPDDAPAPTWEYMGRGPLHAANLTNSTLLTFDQAEQFGLFYGVCSICGRTLKKRDSVERGMGPVCFKRLREQHERQATLVAS